MQEISLTLWTVLYGGGASFFYWINFRGGAEFFEGRVSSMIFINYFASDWDAETIKLYSWLTMIVSTGVFLIGLFNPGVRSALKMFL